MNITELAKIIHTEDAAKQYWRRLREDKGIVCKRCKGKEHHWLSIKSNWSCNKCDFRTTLKSGTVMENSKLPYRYWIHAIYLMLNTKKGASALAIQRQLNAKRYEPIWFMCQKIRLSMGNRDQNNVLKGKVEMDEAFVTVMENIEDRPPKNTAEGPTQYTRGRGSERKEVVAVMASFGTKTLKNGKSKTFLKYLKMQVLLDCEAQTIKETVEENIDPQSKLFTDGHPSYKKLAGAIEQHISKVTPKHMASKTLPVVHLAISNLKRQLLGVHHCVSRGYLQSYLSEFCYKVNRNWLGLSLFDRYMSTCGMAPWYSCG